MKNYGMMIGALLVFVASNAMAATVFTDDFESGLGKWTTGHAQIVVDPIGSNGTNVLNFTQVAAGGDIFTSSAFSIAGGQWYQLSFDYLGTNTTNSGGFIGLAQGLPGSHTWLAGTITNSINTSGSIGIELDPVTQLVRTLTDDNTWHNYVIEFKANTDMQLHVMVEDFSGAGSSAGDAYFDNIEVSKVSVVASSVPLPAAAWGGMMLLGCLGGGRLLGRK